jgi:hypothetical protein
VFAINVGLHGAEERMAEDGVGCHSFGLGHGRWASIDFIWAVVGNDDS